MDELIVVRGSYRITYNDRIDRWYIWNAKGPYLEVKGFRTKQEAYPDTFQTAEPKPLQDLGFGCLKYFLVYFHG